MPDEQRIALVADANLDCDRCPYLAEILTTDLSPEGVMFGTHKSRACKDASLWC